MAAERTATTDAVRAARDLLVEHREDPVAARAAFDWPRPETFNWGLEWFDVLALEHPDRAALIIAEEDGTVGRWSYAELSRRSDQVAVWLRSLGVARGDRMVLMLSNQVELWETILAAIKLGAVVIPASTLLAPADLQDRIDRGGAKHVVARAADVDTFADVRGEVTRIVVGSGVGSEVGSGTGSGVGSRAGSGIGTGSGTGVDFGPGAARDRWISYADSHTAATAFVPDGPTPADATLLLYFTSGTTALPKLVEHTHVSYPLGHLSTVYWIGLKPGDVHLNISSPGWAKHAWSNVFAPWLAGATVFIHNYSRFDAARLMQVMGDHGVSTFCAPPTVWRMLIQADLSVLATPPREVVGAGEPLNPEVIEQVRARWGRTIRDGFGQTETTLAVANTPGQIVKDGSMGRPLPGYPVVLLDAATGAPADEGEICLDLADRPLGLMVGYHGDPDRTAEAMRDGHYHTGDVASRDEDGYLTYVGRADDVFKASDYRISPFELESVLIEHPAVAEAAIVPSPDALRLSVPKAYVVLAQGVAPDAATAKSILSYARQHLAPYKWIRRLEFTELPKTVSGKIRRVELRAREDEIHAPGTPVDGEFRWEDLAD